MLHTPKAPKVIGLRDGFLTQIKIVLKDFIHFQFGETNSASYRSLENPKILRFNSSTPKGMSGGNLYEDIR